MKKTLMIMLALVLVIAMSVTGTLAYLTSTTGTVTNTFSVGSVEITLDEEPVDVYGDKIEGNRRTENSYKLIPGHDYLKDPTIHVTAGSEECYLFIQVVNEIAGIEAEGDTTIAAQMAKYGWTVAEGNIYKHAAVDALNAATNVDVKIFDNFTVADNADVSGYLGKTITIRACAVQVDGLTEADALDVAKAEFAKP